MSEKNIMSKLMMLILSLVILLCVVAGIYAIYQDTKSFTGYIFLGLGLGGLIAFWDVFFSKKSD